MNLSADSDKLKLSLKHFPTGAYKAERLLGLYAAAITFAESELLDLALAAARQGSVHRQKLYEIVLQSYLFLGFPRMLVAAEHLHLMWPDADLQRSHVPSEKHDPTMWHERGQELCKQVYKNKYEALKRRIQSMSHEIFDWMVLEGYGKVLSRPGLTMIEREMAIISFLMIENRDKQLHAHLLGAINVGASLVLIKEVVEDIGPAAGNGYNCAKRVLIKLGIA